MIDWLHFKEEQETTGLQYSGLTVQCMQNSTMQSEFLSLGSSCSRHIIAICSVYPFSICCLSHTTKKEERISNLRISAEERKAYQIVSLTLTLYCADGGGKRMFIWFFVQTIVRVFYYVSQGILFKSWLTYECSMFCDALCKIGEILLWIL